MSKKIISAFAAFMLTITAFTNAFAFEKNDVYDDEQYTNLCETEVSGLTLNDGAPDGSKFCTFVGGDDNKEYKSMEGLAESTMEDYLWELDVRFDETTAGFSIRDLSDNKYNTSVRLETDEETGKLMLILSGSSAEFIEIDPTAWYHIEIKGQFGTTKPASMEIYKWENGEKTLLGAYENIGKRNNVAAGHITIQRGTSFDNVKITKLGADTINISSVPVGTTQINAGASLNMVFEALRQGEDITKPQIEWKVFENGEEITDGSVTIDIGGTLTASADCPDKNVTVKAVSTEKGNVESEYSLSIKALNLDNAKYNVLSLTADNDYVRAGEPLALTVSAKKDGNDVELAEGDVVWKIYDADNQQDTGNRNITVIDNKLTVTEQVISQNIIVRAQNADGTVYASLPIRIKGFDVTEADEEGYLDRLLVADASETYVEGLTQKSPSWDGSHYYEYSAITDLKGVENTTEDIIIELDARFVAENSGIRLRDSGNSKQGGQISRQGDKIGRVGSGSSFQAIANGDAESWYHIRIVTRTAEGSSYAKAYIYKYAEDGSLVNPDDETKTTPAEGTLDLRTMSGKSFHHVQALAGTDIDNMRVMKLVPDEIKAELSANTVFAGGTVQATFSAMHKGEEIPSFPNGRVSWVVYDAEDKYPVSDELSELITVDGNGLVSIDATVNEQTVYIRAISTESGAYSSMPLEIKGSDIFTVTGYGLNKAQNKVIELKVEKNFYYSGDVVFVVAAYDDNGTLIGVETRSFRDNSLTIGENKISIDFDIPENFGKIKTMIWTSL